MSDIAIKVEGLGKQYRLGATREKYYSLRDSIMNVVKSPFRKFSRMCGKAGPENEMFWALKDISFEVKHGEVLGLIGRNGAGKSTLLKILSRITEPTAGRAKLYGRVGSLLEVGTGFHPELTGRENIYLSGAILGMRKSEINRKFDEIVEFSGIEKFLDTPAKRYSSGMYVRLAFAVAAHLEPEILMVDEVLAVGDAEFQKKCLGKMSQVAKGGRTVLFVSHNMGAIMRLCHRCIVLERGAIAVDAGANSAVDHYLSACESHFSDPKEAPGDGFVRLTAVRFVGPDGRSALQFDVRDPILLEIEFEVLQEIQLAMSVQFIGGLGNYIMTSMDNYIAGPWGCQAAYSVDAYKTSCRIPGDLLNEGRLSINLWIYSPPLPPNESPHVRLFGAASCNIIDKRDPKGARGNFPYEWGMEPAVRPRLQWTCEKIYLGSV